MRIVILGYIIRGPYGGLCWDPLQFTLGLKKLGHEVLFLEDSDDFPGHPNPHSIEIAKAKGFDFIKELFTKYGLEDQWSYFDSVLNEWYGLPKIQVFKFCESADILLNISGVNPLRDWHANIPIKIFLDTDPMFTQVKLLQTPTLLDYAKSHSCHFTIAENIGQPDCTIPTDVFDWKATKQPVVLDIWDLAPVNNLGKWTTIMSWKSYKPVIYNNEEYGMKNKSFNPYLKLPRQMPDQIFELGISSNTETKDLLQSNGWNIIEAITPTITPWTYRDYVNNSKGEWSIAKEGFVKSRSGFLSERTMNYMASGKPAVIEDTAFSKYYPTGEGLLCFSSIDECIEGIKKINLDYAFHCRKARQIVEETCNHPLVLTQLLEQAT